MSNFKKYYVKKNLQITWRKNILKFLYWFFFVYLLRETGDVWKNDLHQCVKRGNYPYFLHCAFSCNWKHNDFMKIVYGPCTKKVHRWKWKILLCVTWHLINLRALNRRGNINLLDLLPTLHVLPIDIIYSSIIFILRTWIVFVKNCHYCLTFLVNKYI